MKKQIRIVGVPSGFGFEPENIRQQWVGIAMPLLGECLPEGAWVGTGNENGFIVSRADAINALRNAEKKEMVGFLEGIPSTITVLRFNKRICELIEE
jgi:hypothetical protein